LNQSLYLETKTRLPGWILWKSDRLSMAHSVEARVPFMDHPLVELAARMPPRLKLDGLNEKYALKKTMAPHLPELPTQYKKRGFYTPIREWFFTPERYAELAPYLSDDALKQAGMFEPAAVDAIYQRLSAYTELRDMNDYFQVMRLEWTLMTVLSVQILYRLFVLGEAAP
jgi:asparagine synthase (glutamine-hydrolysing)